MIAVIVTIWLCIGLHAVNKPGSTAQVKPCPEKPHRIESLSLFAPSLGRSKQLFVYLPSGYDCTGDRRYPVFYFNDGHDLFDWSQPPEELETGFIDELSRRESWYGSWRLDSQLERAAKIGRLPPMIIVGIAADDGFRSIDFAPSAWQGSTEAGGVRYADFIASTVVPAIDDRFRTTRDRRCRGVGGASLGAISALQIGLRHRGMFGMVLSLSPVFAEPAFVDYMKVALKVSHGAATLDVLVDFDDDPLGVADQVWFRSLSDLLSAAALRTSFTRTQGGRHRIASWATRALPNLIQLFEKRCN